MKKLTADWVYTLNGPALKNGVVIANEDGTIVDVLPSAEGLEGVERYSGVLCPGFINAHCHLELSHLKGKLSQKTGLIPFIQQVQTHRNTGEEVVQEAMRRAEHEMQRAGIVAVGDISNSAISFPVKEDSTMRWHTFIEVFGFNPANAENIFNNALDLLKEAPHSAGISPHAPYSVSDALLQKISALSQPLVSIHNQETAQEARFFREKKGDFLNLYKGFGLDLDFFQPSGENSIHTYLPQMGTGRKLLVHNTFSDERDLNFAEKYGETYWCLCPNANLYIEDELPDVMRIREKGLKLVFGTDSLASNSKLSILEEMKTVSKHFPDINLSELLTWACRNAADCFSWKDLGRIAKGTRPGINLIEGLRDDPRNDRPMLTPNSRVVVVIH